MTLSNQINTESTIFDHSNLANLLQNQSLKMNDLRPDHLVDEEDVPMCVWNLMLEYATIPIQAFLTQDMFNVNRFRPVTMGWINHFM